MINDFISSMTNIKHYKKVVKYKMTRVIGYLLLITIIFGLLVVLSFQKKYMTVLAVLPKVYDSKVPDFKIQNGKLVTSNNEKLVTEVDGVGMVVDSSIDENSNELKKYDRLFALTEGNIIVKTSSSEITNIPYKNMFNQEMDKGAVRSVIGSIPVFILLLSALILLAFILLSAAYSILFAIVALIFKKMKPSNLKFKEAYKLSVYSLTMPITVIGIISLMPFIKISMFYYFYIYMLAVIYVIRAMARNEF